MLFKLIFKTKTRTIVIITNPKNEVLCPIYTNPNPN